MTREQWIARSALVVVALCLIALPLLGVLRGKTEPATSASAPLEPVEPGVPAAVGSLADPDRVQQLGERGLAAPSAEPIASGEPPPSATVPEVSAAALPTVEEKPQRPSRLQRAARAKGTACGGVELRAITAGDDAVGANATLRAPTEETATSRKAGDTVGSYRVLKIEWDRVTLAGPGGRCTLILHPGLREEAEALGTERDQLPVPPIDVRVARDKKAPKWAVPPAILRGLKVLEPKDPTATREIHLSRDTLGSIFELGEDLLSGLELETERESGRTVGYRLRKLPKDSLLERLGLKEGDRVVSLRGKLPETERGLMRELELGRTESRFEVVIERDKVRITLAIVIAG